MPCVVGIRLSDNEMNHTIYILDNWIFKSNFEKALPLSQESLDICASSSDQKTKFTNATRAPTNSTQDGGAETIVHNRSICRHAGVERYLIPKQQHYWLMA